MSGIHRKSIVTTEEPNEGKCVHHLVFGRGLRELADEDGLTLPMIPAAHEHLHSDAVCAELSKMIGQLAWEKEYYRAKRLELDGEDPAREAFRKRYGRSWL